MPTILYEDNHLIAIDKPAGLLSQGDATGDSSAVDWVGADLKRRHNKPGNVFVGLLHRLDRPVSGVLLLAKTSKAASRVSAQFRDGQVSKTYLAVVEGRPTEPAGTWVDWLRKDEARNVTAVVGPGSAGARRAELGYRVIAGRPRRTLVELTPLTGRGHQLRVQLSSRSMPILGDRRYGSTHSLRAGDGGERIALHAASIELTHPTRDEVVRIISGEPADWPAVGEP